MKNIGLTSTKMHQKKYLDKYLKKYAEAEAHTAIHLFKTQLEKQKYHYDYCLCIPLRDEHTTFVEYFLKFALNHKLLLIIIINQSTDNPLPNAENTAVEQLIRATATSSIKNENLALYSLAQHSAVLLIDRYHKAAGIPRDEGVGLARKIAADVALSLIHNQHIQFPWIFNTDADTSLPNNYFQSAEETIKKTSIVAPKAFNSDLQISTLLYPYQHHNDKNSQCINSAQPYKNSVTAATAIYEKRLHHYVEGLQFANSPYAYHSLGSIICMSAQHYAMVRGFPKRAAGEDFYLLNKLRKTGRILSLEKPRLRIQSRISARTPFGTGTAVKDILANQKIEEAKIFYHPDLFKQLKMTLHWMDQLAIDLPKNSSLIEDSKWQSHLVTFGLQQYQNNIDDSKTLLITSLCKLNFQRCLSHIVKQCHHSKDMREHIHIWFDAFRTLKFLHILRAMNAKWQGLSYRELQESIKNTSD